ncbi:ABC transporter substrate-binding protein [Anaerocolumna sp. MB42-C2]|uniref:ABC transporter substrate-binding protein n=1 Tax=Anaerocolumna sp. MB42-C2 TaxID=3070997 RepID=UPI0027DEDA6D|nr:ABC transporter substrate-binding protein [Anaerocolumna sp. MB42-C2]WMJ89940.1 ABC transporter substrate-binding protein [Anaerocolumna sp. MB42-C2]
MCRKKTALFIALMLVITSLTGCSRAEKNQETGQITNTAENSQAERESKGDKTKEPTMGRYMEEKVKLPELSANETIIKIIENSEKQIEVYTHTNDKYICYRLKKDKTWENINAGWLNNKLILKENIVINDLCLGNDGNYYAVCTDYSSNSMKSIILKSEDGTTSKPVKIPYLEKEFTKNDYKHYPNIISIQVLEDGSMVLADQWDWKSLYVFSKDGAQIDKVRVGQNEYIQNYITSGENIITVNEDKTGVFFYNPVQKETVKTVDFTVSSEASAYALKKDGTLLLGDKDGIHRMQKDGTLWETIVDGSLNSMSMPTLSISSLFVNEEDPEEYYAVYVVTDGGYELMHYVFNKEVSSVPSKEITVYSLWENSTIRQAISLFQAENSDIKVNYVVAMGEESGNIADYIRSLNTELLAGNGADVLVLDGLPVNSYIEKGVLADIKALIEPMEKSGDLLTNITDAYEKDSKIYQMPVRFSLPLIEGEQEAIKAAASTADTADYIKKLNKKPYYKSTIYKWLLADYLALYSRDLFQNGTLDETKFKSYLQNIKTISENIGATEVNKEEMKSNKLYDQLLGSDNLFPGDMSTYNKKYSASILRVKNITDSMLLFAAIKNNNWEYQSINQMFIPSGMVGLNNGSKESDIAKKFISFLFNKEVQDADVYDGFPVNAKSMNGWIEKENDGISIAVSDKDGNMLSADWPTKEERESIKKIAQSVKEPIETNQILITMIIDEVLPFLKGDIDENQATAAVKAKVNTYLAE